MADIKGKDNFKKMPQIDGVDIIPSGGSTGQVLTKDTGTDYDYSWASGGGSGDVSSSANITDHSVVRGDGGAKGVQDSTTTGSPACDVTINDDAQLIVCANKDHEYALSIRNMATNGDGFMIRAGENLGDIAFHIADWDDTFQIMECEADQGYVTFGKTYAQTLTDNGTVYGLDNQHTGTTSKDINTQEGVYRVAGNPVMHGTHYQYAASDGESSTTSTSFVQKLRMTTPSLPAGNYRIGWAGNIQSNSGTSPEWRCQLDDTTTLGISGGADSSTSGSTGFSGFWVGALSAAAHNIDVDYRNVASGTSYIIYVKLEIWRVS